MENGTASQYLDPRVYDPDALAELLLQAEALGLLPEVAERSRLTYATVRQALRAPENREHMISTRRKLYHAVMMVLEEHQARVSSSALDINSEENRAIYNTIRFGVRTYPCEGIFHGYGWPLVKSDRDHPGEHGFNYFTSDPNSVLFSPLRGSERFPLCPKNTHPNRAIHISDRDLRELSSLVGLAVDVWGDDLRRRENRD